jgi:glutamyl/glutaminyl-tRNA synthetase
MAEAGELAYFFMKPAYEIEKTVWKGDTPEETTKHFIYILASIEKIPENRFSESAVKDALWDYATKSGKGSVLWPLRYALSGREKSPDPFVLAGILGKQETLSRVQEALKKLRA